MPPLPQGDDAAPAAGLKEMSLGFGPDGSTTSMGMGDDKPKRRKKKGKAKKAEGEAKAEL